MLEPFKRDARGVIERPDTRKLHGLTERDIELTHLSPFRRRDLSGPSLRRGKPFAVVTTDSGRSVEVIPSKDAPVAIHHKLGHRHAHTVTTEFTDTALKAEALRDDISRLVAEGLRSSLAHSFTGIGLPHPFGMSSWNDSLPDENTVLGSMMLFADRITLGSLAFLIQRDDAPPRVKSAAEAVIGTICTRVFRSRTPRRLSSTLWSVGSRGYDTAARLAVSRIARGDSIERVNVFTDVLVATVPTHGTVTYRNMLRVARSIDAVQDMCESNGTRLTETDVRLFFESDAAGVSEWAQQRTDTVSSSMESHRVSLTPAQAWRVGRVSELGVPPHVTLPLIEEALPVFRHFSNDDDDPYDAILDELLTPEQRAIMDTMSGDV